MKTTTDERLLSSKLYEKACAVIPGGVNSPIRSFRAMEMTPLVVERGEGDLLYDVDGRSYIDFCGSWGALILGHAYPSIAEAMHAQIGKGTTYGALTTSEEELASRVVQLIPSIEKIRFVSSGTEATMSALRLARGYTGRSLIAKFSGHYHGHSDPLLVQAGSGVVDLTPTSSSLGVPSEAVLHTRVLPFNDFATCRRFFAEEGHKLAAVIVEPIPANMGVIPQLPGFLRMLRDETKKCGALLIMDEVITGFRLGLDGAQGYYGVTPDLTCLGKIIGGGLPAAAFGGKKEIMDCLAPIGKVFQAGTLSGCPLAMEAGLATLNELAKPGFYEQLQEKTDYFLDPIRHFLTNSDQPVALQSIGSLFTLFFGVRHIDSFEEREQLDLARYKAFFHYLFERGVYLAPLQFEANFLSIVHTEEHLKYAQRQILNFLEG